MSRQIKCLAIGIQYHYPPSEPGRDQLILEGKIFNRPISFSYWWLDETFLPHCESVERKKDIPRFKIIDKPGVRIEVRGFCEYSVFMRP